MLDPTTFPIHPSTLIAALCVSPCEISPLADLTVTLLSRCIFAATLHTFSRNWLVRGK